MVKFQTLFTSVKLHFIIKNPNSISIKKISIAVNSGLYYFRRQVANLLIAQYISFKLQADATTFFLDCSLVTFDLLPRSLGSTFIVSNLDPHLCNYHSHKMNTNQILCPMATLIGHIVILDNMKMCVRGNIIVVALDLVVERCHSFALCSSSLLPQQFISKGKHHIWLIL